MAKPKKTHFKVEDILQLFKEKLNITPGRSGIYFYIQKHGFPSSTGWGNPRQWEAAKVEKWFKERTQ